MISSIVFLGLLDVLKIFWQLQQIELLGLLITVVLDISKAFNRVWRGGPFHQLSLTDFWGRNLVLFCLFLVIDNFDWFLMGSLKNIKLMREFLRIPFFVPYFYYTLMTFLMVLSVILLYMLMISTLNVIRHLIHGSN